MDKKGVLKNPVTKTELKRVEQTLSEKIDRNSEKIDRNSEKIDRNSEKIDRNSEKIDRNSEKIDRHSEKIDRHSETIDRLIRQVIENTDWIKNKLVTKEEFEKKFNQVLDGQDSMVGILREMKQECVMRGGRIDRIEADVEKNTREIGKIKTKLAMV